MCERHETENYISAFICNWLVAMFHLCQLSCQCIPPQHEVWRWRGAGVTLFLLGGQQLVTTGPEPGKMGNNKQWTNIFCSNFMPSFVLLQSEKKQSRAKFLTSWVRLRSEPNNEKDAFLHSLVAGPSLISKVRVCTVSSPDPWFHNHGEGPY